MRESKRYIFGIYRGLETVFVEVARDGSEVGGEQDLEVVEETGFCGWGEEEEGERGVGDMEVVGGGWVGDCEDFEGGEDAQEAEEEFWGTGGQEGGEGGEGDGS